MLHNLATTIISYPKYDILTLEMNSQLCQSKADSLLSQFLKSPIHSQISAPSNE